MSDPQFPGAEAGDAGRDEMMAALFAQMVMQQANLAMMLLGKMPHPQSGQTVQDLEGARMFIDQLEMLEAKTKGNLSKDEEKLLKQSLMSLQMAFVEAVQSPAPAPPPAASDPAARTGPPPPGTQPAPTQAEEEGRKKFSKKY